MEFCQIAFQPPPLKQTDALWELFSPKISQFFKTAVLTLEMDIIMADFRVNSTSKVAIFERENLD